MPVLGICRGIQFLNAYLGGTLYQDLNTQHPTATEHHQKPPYDVPVHNIRIQKDSRLHKLLGTDSLAVNSYHHQAIKKKADVLVAMAVSEDGLVEAVRMPEKNLCGRFSGIRSFRINQISPQGKYLRSLSEAAK